MIESINIQNTIFQCEFAKRYQKEYSWSWKLPCVSKSDNEGQDSDPDTSATTRRRAVKGLTTGAVSVLGLNSVTTRVLAKDPGDEDDGPGTDDNLPGGGGGGGTPTWEQNDTEVLSSNTLHAGSALEQFEADPGSSHEFRVAGSFSVTDNEGLAELADYDGVSTQKVRIVNESPGGLSVFTSPNSAEIAMNPVPANHADADADAALDTVTSAAALACAAAGYTAGSYALAGAGLIAGMYALYSGGGGNNGEFNWEGLYTGDRVQGGHHVDFGVNEHGGGNIKVESLINPADGVRNEWNLSFDNGLESVTKV
jgi:hypothetical protein